MSDITLWCLIVDNAHEAVGNTFPVTVATTDLVGQLAVKILASEVPTKLREMNLRATELELWKLKYSFAIVNGSIILDAVRTLRLNRETGKEDRDQATCLPPLKKISEEFGEKPEEDCVHVLVQLPERKAETSEPGVSGTLEAPQALIILTEEASDTLQHLRTKKARTQPPLLRDLFAILDRPLDETEKIAVSHETYDDLISPLYERDDICREEDVAILFKKREFDVYSPLNSLYTAVVESPRATSGTEQFFRGFWDRNIKDVVALILQQDPGDIIRSNNYNTDTRKLRPDFVLLVQNVCVFRGEERGPDDLYSEDPRAELVDKLNWVYDPAEYMLGYYCRGLDLTLVALCPPLEQGGKPVIQDLASANLRFRRERIKNIRRLINLSTLLKPLSDLVQYASGEFKPMPRNLSTVEITASCIVKTYTCHDADARVQHLKNVYTLLRSQNVPNTDRIILAKGKALYLAPRGFSAPPKIQADVRECVICVLETLVALHKIPIFHRDIRWANIIRNVDDRGNWFLIDWEEAAMPPTEGQPRFSTSDHSPRIREDNHGAEVDIWGVGHLITSSTAADLSNEFKALGKRVCDEANILTAQEVLELVKSHP